MLAIKFPRYSMNRIFPYYWQEDTTGVLRRSVEYFICQKRGNPPSLDPRYHQEQLEILRRYFGNYIAAPCWAVDNHEIQLLKDVIKLARGYEGLKKWHNMAIKIGIDPI